MGFANRVLWTLLSLVVLAGRALAQPVEIGPTGIRVTDVAVAPAAPGLIYVASGSGVQKSVDGGTSWAATPRVPGEVTNVVIDSLSAQTVFAIFDVDGSASSRLYRSRDGGESWTSVAFPSQRRIRRVTVRGSTVYAAAYGYVLLPNWDLGHRDASMVSRDGGTTWLPLGFTTNPIEAFAIDPVNPNETLAFSSWDFYRTNDAGGHWSLLFEEQWAGFRACAIDPTNPSIVYLGASSGMRRSVDGGATWGAVGLDAGSVNAIIVDPSSPSTVYAGTSGGLFRSADSGESWQSIGFAFESVDAVALDPASPGSLYVIAGGRLFRVRPEGPKCAPGASTLCLNGGRFQVQVTWQSTGEGSGLGHAIPLSSNTGYFWFFDGANIELAVKILDGTAYNGKFWFFAGSLTDVGYTIVVTDTETGVGKSYRSAPGRMSSFADTSAFPRADGAVVEVSGDIAAGPTPATAYLGAVEACTVGRDSVCLSGGRFRAQVTWRTTDGRSGAAQANAVTSDTGSFWFFQESNVELVLKVLDGRSLNGHYWVFYGALSDVAYTITVTDTETGIVKTYDNPQGTLASHADTDAF